MTSSAVIFDMDGVLIDSEPFWRESEIETFAQVGMALRETDCALTKGWRIDEVVAFWRTRRPWRGASDAQMVEKILAGVVQRIERRGVSLPGVERAIEELLSHGIRLALATSSPMPIVEAVLSRLKLVDAFEVVCSAQDDDFGKPHPQVFLRTAASLGLQPMAITVIEDSVAGMVAAKAARMRCIVVPDPSEADLPQWGLADHRLASLSEFEASLVLS